MKGYWIYSSTVIVSLHFSSNVIGATTAENTWDDSPQKVCEQYGLATTRKMRAALGLIPGRPIKVPGGPLIKVAYFKDDTGNFVAILTKKPKQKIETAEVSTICLNRTNHPAHSQIKGEIEFMSHRGIPLNIRFHLQKNSQKDGYLAQTSWRSLPPSNSLGVSEPGTVDMPPNKPNAGQLPKSNCLPPDSIIGGGDNEDLSFEFKDCLTPDSKDFYYRYNLFFNRNVDGIITLYDLDPQIINHGH